MNNEFKPLDLNYLAVTSLFKKCLATENSSQYIPAQFQQIKQGYKEDSPLVLFDANAFKENKPKIDFILGQLLDVHQGPNNIITINSLFKKYNGELWTTDGVTLIKLIHLALANSSIDYFVPPNNESTFLSIIEPTLSPKDPNFEEWYKGYKQKILKKSDGQEPADN
ncbi:MAG: hypothetical protein IKJ36_01875 [Clostridia bacterium]|nr:hypothetical protein [Clostridia bacterium]